MDAQVTGTQEQSSYWERVALASGFVYMVAQIAALIVFGATLVPNMPAVDAPVVERADFYVDYASGLTVVNYVLVVPVLFLLIFIGGLHSVLRRMEGDAGTFATIALAAGIAVSMTWPLGIVITNVGVEIAREGGDPATVSALDAMAPYTLALSAFPKAVLLAASSLVIHQAAVPQRWLAWAGFLLAGLTLVGTATLLEGGFFPLTGLTSLLFYLWIGAVSISLLRGIRHKAFTPAPARIAQ